MEPRTNAPGRSHGRGRLSRPGLARRGAAGPGEAWRGRARAPGHEQKLPTTLTIRPPAHHWRASARLVRASARAKTTRQEEDTRQPLEQQKTLVVGRKPTGGDIAAESTERPPRAFPAPAPPRARPPRARLDLPAVKGGPPPPRPPGRPAISNVITMQHRYTTASPRALLPAQQTVAPLAPPTAPNPSGPARLGRASPFGRSGSWWLGGCTSSNVG